MRASSNLYASKSLQVREKLKKYHKLFLITIRREPAISFLSCLGFGWVVFVDTLSDDHLHTPYGKMRSISLPYFVFLSFSYFLTMKWMRATGNSSLKYLSEPKSPRKYFKYFADFFCWVWKDFSFKGFINLKGFLKLFTTDQ